MVAIISSKRSNGGILQVDAPNLVFPRWPGQQLLGKTFSQSESIGVTVANLANQPAVECNQSGIFCSFLLIFILEELKNFPKKEVESILPPVGIPAKG